MFIALLNSEPLDVVQWSTLILARAFALADGAVQEMCDAALASRNT